MRRYSELAAEVSRLNDERGPDDPEYQKRFAELLQLGEELGIENDPGEE
jgi:hypothetical protein